MTRDASKVLNMLRKTVTEPIHISNLAPPILVLLLIVM
ncbi:hypothetical protein SDC9_154349 [bioreactor metagenome]|uniref:Uncharacterized protein n=1 Tax=bioreactor metagenome TaxID=1076179 RepID=A0A645F349_9ZZZZ